MARSHSESVALNMGSSYVLVLINALVSFVIRTVFIKTLGMQYTGVSTLFIDILNMLALAELGVSTAITFALYKPIREGDWRRVSALMRFYKKAYRLIAAFVFTAGLCCLPFLHLMVKNVPDIEEDIRVIFMLYVVNNAASYLLAYKHTLLTASERRYVISNTGVWFSLAKMVIECAVLIATRNFILYLLIGLLDALVRNYAVSKKADKFFLEVDAYPDEKLTREETVRLLTDVGALALYKICQVILNSTDSIVISSAPALGVLAVGYLGNYRLLYNTITTPINQFYNAFTPSLGVMVSKSDPDKQHTVFETTNFLSFWAICFCSTSLFCLSVPFVSEIWLRGTKFKMSMDIIAVLTFNFYTSAMMRPTNAFRNSNGLFIQGKFRPLLMAVINIAMDIALVKPLGVFGVLLATSIARITTQTWYDPLLLYRKLFNKPVRRYYIQYAVYTCLTALSCAGTWVLCRQMAFIGNTYLRFFAMMVLCLIVPNLMVVAIYRKTVAYHGVIARGKVLVKGIARRLGGKKREAPAESTAEEPESINAGDEE